jgi:fumarylacetoacetase
MMIALNETHDPTRRSFVASANTADSEFPIQNLPFGVFRPAAGLPARVGVAIGDQVLDVAAAASAFDGLAAEAAGAAKCRIWIICCRSGRRLGRRCGLLCRAA